MDSTEPAFILSIAIFKRRPTSSGDSFNIFLLVLSDKALGNCILAISGRFAAAQALSINSSIVISLFTRFCGHPLQLSLKITPFLLKIIAPNYTRFGYPMHIEHTSMWLPQAYSANELRSMRPPYAYSANEPSVDLTPHAHSTHLEKTPVNDVDNPVLLLFNHLIIAR